MYSYYRPKTNHNYSLSVFYDSKETTGSGRCVLNYTSRTQTEYRVSLFTEKAYWEDALKMFS